MKWADVLFRLWAVVTAVCLLLVIEPFTGPETGVAICLMTVVALGFAFRWAIGELSQYVR